MSILEITRESSPEICFRIENPSFRAHFHRNIELLYPIENDIDVILNNEHVNLKKNHLLFIESYAVHHILGKTKTIVLCFPLKYLNNFFAFTKDMDFCKKIIQDQDCTLKNMLMEFIDIKVKNSLYIQGKIDVLLGHLVDLIGLKNKKSSSKDVVKRTITFLNEHFEEPITLDIIANNICYSKHTISHNFLKNTGFNIREYLNQIRLNAFIQRVQTSPQKSLNNNLTELILNAGFTSVQTFYRIFKQQYCVSPKNFISKIDSN